MKTGQANDVGWSRALEALLILSSLFQLIFQTLAPYNLAKANRLGRSNRLVVGWAAKVTLTCPDLRRCSKALLWKTAPRARLRNTSALGEPRYPGLTDESPP